MPQCFKLLVFCCAIVGSEELVKDKLLHAAAIRTFVLLVDPESWKEPDGQRALNELLVMLSQSPAMFNMLGRLLVADMEDTPRQSNIKSLCNRSLCCARCNHKHNEDHSQSAGCTVRESPV